MWQRIVIGWYALPSWAHWALIILVVIAFDAIRMAWGEERFVGGFFEAFVASFIYLGIPLFALVGAIIGGNSAFERTRSALVGWLVGILIFLAVGGVRYFANDIPGVGWRLRAMDEAREWSNDLGN